MFNKKQEISFIEEKDGIKINQHANGAFSLGCFLIFVETLIENFKKLGLPIEPLKKTLIKIIENTFNENK